jgi:hypothetical protein
MASISELLKVYLFGLCLPDAAKQLAGKKSTTDERKNASFFLAGFGFQKWTLNFIEPIKIFILKLAQKDLQNSSGQKVVAPSKSPRNRRLCVFRA